MLISYLAILFVLYTSAAVTAYVFGAPPTIARGEFLAVALCLVGLAVSASRLPMPRWRYLSGVLCAIAAPAATLIFHDQIAAQVWAVVPLMFMAVYLRSWHRRAVARAAAVLIALVGVAALLVAPAPVPPLWLLLYVACIVGGAEVVGMMCEALVDAALRDPLTAIWNRAGVEREAGRLISQARRRAEPVAVVVLDVDDFKAVNDRDGHTAGDVVLARLTRRWVTLLPAAGAIGRVGGDEFAVVLGGYGEEQARMLAAELVDGDELVKFSV